MRQILMDADLSEADIARNEAAINSNANASRLSPIPCTLLNATGRWS